MKICIIIPCYNEESRLKTNCFVEYLKKNSDVTFLFVNDGSSDRTWEIIEKLRTENDRIKTLNLNQNSGKAEAVRQGILHALTLPCSSNLMGVPFSELKDIYGDQYNIAPFDLIGFWDADLATPLDEIEEFEKIFLEKKVRQIVFGSRILKLGNNIQRKVLRHLLGRVFATVVSVMSQVKVYDTQCGAKIFHKDIVEKCFKDPFISKWFFDVEILLRVKKTVGAPHLVIFEKSLTSWKDEAGSKVKLKDFLRVPWELLKIFSHYN